MVKKEKNIIDNSVEYRGASPEEVEKLIKEGKLKPEDTARLSDFPNRKVSVKYYATPRK